MTTTATAERPAEVLQAKDQAFKVVPLNLVHESKSNPRKTFDPKAQRDLEASIKEKGIIVPLLVRPMGAAGSYEIVAGARRYRAAKSVGLLELPVLVRELTDDQALEAQVIENLQRADVHPLEEAEGYKALLGKGKYDVEAIAAKVGKSGSYVYQRLKLAELIEPAKKAFLAGELTPSHAVLIARLQPADQKEALEVCFQDGYSDAVNQHFKRLLVNVRELQAWISSEIHLDLHSAPWKKDDPTLVISAGPCTTCPKRAGACPQLFPDIEKKDTCTDRGCFHAKQEAHIAREIKAMEKEGKKLQKIAVDWQGDAKKGVLGENEYRKAQGKKKCPTTVPAIYVDGPNLGHVTEVCTNRACKIHGEHYSSGHSGSSSGSRTADEERKRQAELLKERITARAREILLRAVIERTHSLARADLELVAHASQGLPYPSSFLDGFFPILGKVNNVFGHRGALDKASDDELAKYLVAGALSDELGTYGKAPRLYATAKRLKVDVAKLEAQAKTEKTNEKLHHDQVQKWKNRVASKAARYDVPTCTVCGCIVANACPGGCFWIKFDKKTNRGLCSACKDAK